jgi:hypothetical protein
MPWRLLPNLKNQDGPEILKSFFKIIALIGFFSFNHNFLLALAEQLVVGTPVK